jgi:Rieske Fe-S protein
LTPSPDDTPHVPGPTIWPFVLAFGIAIALVGVIVDPKIVVPLGLAIVVVSLVGWSRESKAAHAEPVELEPEQRAPAEPAIPANEGEAAAAPTTDEELEEKYPRSVFLEAATLGLGGVIGGLVTVPALGFALLPAFTKQHKVSVDLGPIDNFPESSDQWTIATFMTDESVGEVSRQTAYVRNNGLTNVNGKQEPSFTIISNHCAHLGCPVQPAGPIDESKTKTIVTGSGKTKAAVTLIPALPAGGFACPCHGGAYDQEGNRTAGPPVRALDRFNFSIVNGHLFLEKSYSVAKVEGTGANAQIWKYARHNPGQPVSGIERFFYPIQPPGR